MVGASAHRSWCARQRALIETPAMELECKNRFAETGAHHPLSPSVSELRAASAAELIAEGTQAVIHCENSENLRKTDSWGIAFLPKAVLLNDVSGHVPPGIKNHPWRTGSGPLEHGAGISPPASGFTWLRHHLGPKRRAESKDRG